MGAHAAEVPRGAQGVERGREALHARHRRAVRDRPRGRCARRDTRRAPTAQEAEGPGDPCADEGTARRLARSVQRGQLDGEGAHVPRESVGAARSLPRARSRAPRQQSVLCRARHNIDNAASRIMPRGGRAVLRRRRIPRSARVRCRHNQRLSRNASSSSFGRNRAGTSPIGSAWASARSFNRMSACT
jgi:hypothetical protein